MPGGSRNADDSRRMKVESRRRRSMRHMVRNPLPVLRDEEPLLTSVCSWVDIFWCRCIVITRENPTKRTPFPGWKDSESGVY